MATALSQVEPAWFVEEQSRHSPNYFVVTKKILKTNVARTAQPTSKALPWLLRLEKFDKSFQKGYESTQTEDWHLTL